MICFECSFPHPWNIICTLHLNQMEQRNKTHPPYGTSFHWSRWFSTYSSQVMRWFGDITTFKRTWTFPGVGNMWRLQNLLCQVTDFLFHANFKPSEAMSARKHCNKGNTPPQMRSIHLVHFFVKFQKGTWGSTHIQTYLPGSKPGAIFSQGYVNKLYICDRLLRAKQAGIYSKSCHEFSCCPWNQLHTNCP